MATPSYDYIIVGAGSAGSVLAYRLGANPDLRILVLEAGGMDYSFMIHMPAGLSYPMNNPRYAWQYHSVPEAGMHYRRFYTPRGRGIGGSSSINGMVYIRGHALDYDRWARETADPSWSHSHCLPYFRKAQTFHPSGDGYFNPQWQGDSGPLHVSRGERNNPLYQAWLEAGIEAGYPSTPDLNGAQQEGLGPMDMTVYKGRRWSAAMAYLRPALARGNVALQTHSHVHKIVFTHAASGLKAHGVEVLHKGQVQRIAATREVLLCGGAINSPHILQLSGVGAPEHLARAQIKPLHVLSGVGENLQDHLETYIQYACTQPITLYSAMNFMAKAKIGLQWLALRSGLGATNHFETGGFIRSAAGVQHPDLQYHFLPMAVRYDGNNPASAHGFQAHVGPMRPTSRGWVRSLSADPLQAPEICFNYLQTEQDRKEFRAGVRLTRELFLQKAFDRFRGAALAPIEQIRSDTDIDAWLRQEAETAYHPSCSCAMGPDPAAGAVVDSQARVHGIAALRVVDSSIMPSIVSGNLNAPTIMLAEKLADVIAGQPALAAAQVTPHVHAHWQTQQR